MHIGSMRRTSMLNGYFFFNDTATTEIYTLSLHDALPISGGIRGAAAARRRGRPGLPCRAGRRLTQHSQREDRDDGRSEEHTSELQSRQYLVCRLLLEKKKHTSRTVTDFGNSGR